MSNGPKRESQSFRVAISVVRRAMARRPLTTQLVGGDTGLNKYLVTQIISRNYSNELDTCGGVICFTANDGGDSFLLEAEKLEDKINARERKRK